jgi:putative CocE/NonD family hydrolase
MAALLATVPVALLVLSVADRPLCAQDRTVSSSARPTQAASAGLAQYVGQYRGTSDPDQVNAVYLDDGVLYEESERRARQRLVPDAVPGSADRFQIELPQAHVVFLRDASGMVSGLKFVLDSDGHTLVEERRFSAAGTRLNHFREYTRQEAMLPMRDGLQLHAVILSPADQRDVPPAGLPFLLARTPYGVDDFDSESVNQDKPELAASGYIFVYEDIRGRYQSEGRFVMNRPIVPHNSNADVDETTDARDTIDWLLKNVPDNNGRVGVFGLSYDGFLAMMAGIDAHPAVKAISPQAPMTDVWMGDDFFHNGAFRQGYGFDYVQQMEAQKTDARVDLKQDTYDFFLRHVNFASAVETVPKMNELPSVKAFLTQPAYTKFWRDMAVEDHLTEVEVPTLEVGGYWDQEDMWGTQAEYAALKKHDDEVFLVLGPWNHGGWQDTGRRLGSEFGRLDFGEPTGSEFHKRFEAPFFERYLKDRPGFDLADTASFRTGVNQWKRYDVWPPVAGFEAARVYLEPGKKLSFAAPATKEDTVAAVYIADPADPVPYRHRPIQSTYAKGSKWYTWLVEDQRFVTGRKDVANFTMPALDHDVTITGDVLADLFAATTGSDADWIVKLIDVYPDDVAAPPQRASSPGTPAAPPQRASPPGTPAAPPQRASSPGTPAAPNAGYQLMVAEDIFRGRYLKSFEQAEPLNPGEVNEFKWSLHGVDHTFLKGHSILVEVQSSWFPLYDRNPQTFVANIMSAPKSAYQAETVTIYGSPQYPSHLEFEVER